MRNRTQYVIRERPDQSSTNLLIGFVAGIVFGALGGYVLGSQTAIVRTAVPAVVAAPATTSQAPPLIDERELDGYRNILQADPKNLRAAVELGNRLYDAGRFAEAVPHYQLAMTLNPKDIGVSTDLGTSLWNAGRTDEALAQFDRSLALDPKHPQTLFNIGIVRMNGKADALGAIDAWERLLAAHPAYPEQARVRQLIADARVNAGALKPIASSR